MQLLHLSLCQPDTGEESALDLYLEEDVYRFRVGPVGRGAEHRAGAAAMPAFCRDVAALEPNRWREGDNALRCQPPLSDTLTQEDEHLIRAMALVLCWAFEQSADTEFAPQEWLLRQKIQPLVLTGPQRQCRRVFFVDPNGFEDDWQDCLQIMWEEGLLVELVVDPRLVGGGKVQACYLTLPLNKVLYPKVLALAEGVDPRVNDFWKLVLAGMDAAPQVDVGAAVTA